MAAERRRKTDDPAKAGKPGYLPIDDVVMGEVIKEITESNLLKRTIIFWARVIAGLCIAVLVLVVALQIQIDRRNDQIDQVEGTTNRVERVACGFADFIPDERRGDLFVECDRFTTTTTEE